MGKKEDPGSDRGYVTIRDIAARAGVSANSVSRALNDKGDIGDETKARVRDIARELGYIRHAAASGLRSGGSRSIGVIVTHIDNAFFSRILQGITDCASAKEYTILMLASNEDVETEARNLRLLAAFRVAGILYIPSRDLENGIDYSGIQAPHVEIVRHMPSSTCGYFVSDSRRSGELAADRLVSSGRKRLSYLGFDERVSCNRDRLGGYRKKALESGAALGKGSVRLCGASAAAAYETMSRWIREGFDYDGLFVYNDAMAFGAIRALVDSKARVPDDVSVVGHDDIDTAESFIPRLTTIQVPKYRLGFDSAASLLDTIESVNPSRRPERVVYDPELIVRET
ncbi:MAG: LacI family transcriptional regulator [Spirochaetes bacterium]|nr:LacI family transcriptional regulator [Spirochaetota bacterium]MBU1081019.1 LacI family transcriptional regulator [Spirochaetota bacterium]